MSISFKKITSSISAIAIAFMGVSPSLISASSGFKPYAEALATAGIITTQSTEAGYRLADNALRQEVAAIMMALNEATYADNFTCLGSFSDVSSTKPNSWVCKVVETALNNNLIAANKTFRPMDNTTRAEALAMILKGQGIEIVTATTPSFSDTTGWQANVANTALEQGIISANPKFRPNDLVTRGELFVMAANAAGLEITSSDDVSVDDDFDWDDLIGDDDDTSSTGSTSTGTTSTGSTDTGTVVKAGDLNVGLNPASHTSGTQIPMAGTIRFAVVDFTAGGSDVTLNTVEIQKAALASIPSGTKAWFEKEGTRVSGKTSFTSENTAVISFAPAFVVKAGATESLNLYVEISTSAGNDIQFASSTINSTAANITGSFTTPVLRTASYSVATSTITGGASGQSYNASTDAIEIAKFTVTNTNSNSDTRDIKFQSLTLYQSGTANLTNLTDIIVERNGVVVSSGYSIDGKTLSLTINDVIKDGATAIYIIKGKVTNVELTTDSYQLYVKSTSDINLIESATAFRATISSTAPITAGLYQVSGGDVKFERNSSVALSKTVAPGTSDVVFMEGTITAKSPITLEDVTLGYSVNSASNTGLTTELNTVYLKIGSSTFTWTPANGSAASFLGTASVNGTAEVKLYAKLKDGATATSIKFNSLGLSNFTTKEYTINQNNVASAIGSIEGSTITVGASTLNVTKTDGLGSTTLASGSKGVTVYGVKFSSTQGNTISLSNLSVTTAGNANSYTGGNTSLTLYVDGVAKSTKSLSTTSLTFDGFNTTVSTTKSVEVVIKADFSDITTSGTFNIASISYDAVDDITSATVTKPTVSGATFTIATAVGTLSASTGDSAINKSLLLAGSTNQKISAFRVKATNDNIKLKNLTITGANLNTLSNIRLVNSTLNTIQTASNITSTGATFANVDNSTYSTINKNETNTYYIIADINSNTTQTGVYCNIAYTGSNISSSNGSVVNMIGVDVIGEQHDISENTFKVTQETPSSKSVSSNAMKFKVEAFGTDGITLSGATFTTTLGAYSTAGYTGGTIKVYYDNNLVGTANLNSAGTGITAPITFSSNYNEIDAGTQMTYEVRIEGLTLNASTNEAWTLNLTSLTTSAGLDAANYPKNVETFPLRSYK